MPIISTIGRRSLQTRLLIGAIYLVLIVGSVSMVFPFMLMISGSTKSTVDSPDAQVIPQFLINDLALYRKYIEALYNESLNLMRICDQVDTPSFRKLEFPTKVNRKYVGVWQQFIEKSKLPSYYYALGLTSVMGSRSVQPSNFRPFKHQLIEEFKGDITALNNKMQTNFNTWNNVGLIRENYMTRYSKLSKLPYNLAYQKYKETRPVDERFYFDIEGYYKSEYLKMQYTRKIAEYNIKHHTNYKSWDAVHLPRRLPKDGSTTSKIAADWEAFARTIINPLWIYADKEASPGYHEFLVAKYGDIKTLRKRYELPEIVGFSDLPFPSQRPEHGLPASDWEAFLQGWKEPVTGKIYILPAEMISIHSVQYKFQDFLQKKYINIENLNQDLSLDIISWADIVPPQQGLHYLSFLSKKSELRWEFVKRNFIAVFDYVVLHGRAIYNTVIYCGLAILAALVVNPLAAYALSRYKPPSSYKILLILMMTMAFPPMVTQIPAFLMLREFGLLNSFWALILPGLANGYAIFLLKGFFDSLPRELYESAELDGAGEFRIFWQFTMCLSKPILAVIALSTFTIAYGNFMMALLVCQDEKMWTIMPWLYQLQQNSCEGVIFASLLIAAIPTFLIFVFCQNIIMRGIVVPSEK